VARGSVDGLTHQQQRKGLIISNMMASIPAYNDYAEKVLMATMDPDLLAELKAFEAAEEWPDFVNTSFEHVNPNVYVLMQGPSELGASGRIAEWDRTADLGAITVPTLVVGATHDTP
jgi:proline iminopeptidase